MLDVEKKEDHKGSLINRSYSRLHSRWKGKWPEEMIVRSRTSVEEVV